jgi:putative hydrolase of HD superfamily
METLISHNEADIATWLPLEYEENLTYGQKNCQWSEWTRQLKEEIKKDSLDKIKKESK